MKTLLPTFLLPASLCMAVQPLSADQASGNDSNKAPTQSHWVQSVPPGSYLLNSDRFREGIGLSEKQKRKLDTLAKKTRELWSHYSEKGTASRERTGDAIWRSLTDGQKDKLVNMKAISGSWFNSVSYTDSLTTLGVGEKEREKIKAIIDAHNKERTEAFRSVAKPDPKAAERYKEYQQRQQKLYEEAKKEVHGLLGKVQFESLLDIVAKARIQTFVIYEPNKKELGITERQAKKIGELINKRDESWRELAKIEDIKERSSRWLELQERTATQMFGILTDTQRKRIREMLGAEQSWFYTISKAGTKDKLDLSPEVKERLEAVLKDFHSARMDALKPDPEAAKRSREVQERYGKMVEKAKADIRAVLTDDQFDALVTRIAKTQLPYIHKRQDVANELDLSEKQVSKLEALAKKLTDSARTRSEILTAKRKALYEKADALLSENQKKKLIEKIRSPQPVVRVQGGQGGQGGAGVLRVPKE